MSDERRAASSERRKVAIIGGGISGLSCAWYVREALRQKGLTAQLKVYEAGAAFGGSIRTHAREGFLYEDGPDTFISEKPWALELCRQLGLESELIGVQPDHQRSSMVYEGRLYPIPKGFYLMASPSLRTLLDLPFVSWKGKWRMLLEPLIPVGGPQGNEDESVADFMRRRFGEEALWRIGQPMIGGIYTADPEKLSLLATFPKFREMERNCGGVVKGLRQRVKKAEGVSGPRYGLFLSFRSGMQTLIDRLTTQLGSVLESGRKVVGLKRGEHEWEIEFGDGRQECADAVCLALTAPAAARVTAGLSSPLSQLLQSIPYEDAVTLNFAFKAADCPQLPSGAGFVIPKLEELPLVGVTFAHQKFAGRVPEEGALIRCFMGGVYHREVLRYSPAQQADMALETLRKLLHIRANPLWQSFVRYHEAMPQFQVGHYTMVAALHAQVEKFSGLFLTGNYLSGVGIPDCVHESRKAADTLVNFLTESVLKKTR